MSFIISWRSMIAFSERKRPMSRAGMMMLFRAQIAAVEAEIRAKQAEIASLQASREAAEAKLEELHHHKDRLLKDGGETGEDGESS
jgi:hypothetical protein